ncbi:hypothetical protein FRC01_002717 [Tulasnella sp. 417]|nr:hypothetical protein FRC01_002717 [Tulasnella sp. 417]
MIWTGGFRNASRWYDPIPLLRAPSETSVFEINDVSAGVEYLHNREPPINHGDLKSVNVLVNSKYRAVITDFGSARHHTAEDPDRETTRLTKKELQHARSPEAKFCPSTNTITLTRNHYTLRWAAPELLQDENVGLACDIWALGCVAYEVMTNSIPFHDVKDAVVIRRVVNGDLLSVSSDARMLVFQALCSLVEQCWNMDPSKRPTAEECQDAIYWMPMVVPNAVGRRQRINPSSIKFLKDTPELEGGSAVVSRALLAISPYDATDQGLGATSEGSSKRTSVLRGDNEYQKAKASGQEWVSKEGVVTERQGPESGGDTSERWKAVAVKKMKISDNLARVLGLALREAEFLVGLSHENIVSFEGFVEDISEGMVWLLFPWQDNGNLRTFIASADWEIPERISLIADVTRGVEYLHSRDPPIYHGDLKSMNVLVNSECHAVLTDFGTSGHPGAKDSNRVERKRAIEELQQPSVEATFCSSTNTMTLTGDEYTLRWAAPELLEGGDAHLTSDIWALGWDTKDTIVIRRIVRGDLPSISSDTRILLIRALCALMADCWSVNPSNRPTAPECRQIVQWMPMITPRRLPTKDAAKLDDRSPALLMELGHMHQNQSDYRTASEYYTRALSAYSKIADKTGTADAMSQLAAIHKIQSQYHQAIEFYAECLQIWTDIGDRRGRAEGLWGLAEVHRLRTEYSQAVTLYVECLEIWTDIDDRRGRAEALWGLAEVHRLQHNYTQAITLYLECLQIRADIGDRRGRAEALWSLAEVHRLQHEYTYAITLYSECLQIQTDIGNRQGRAEALLGLAEVYRLQNECNQAAKFYSECLQIQTDIGNMQGRVEALLGLAEVHRLRNEYTDAMILYSVCTQIQADIGNTQGSAEALLSLAEIHRLRDECSEAIALFSEALTTFTDLSNEYWRACTLLGMGDAYRDQDDHANAIHYYTQAAEIFKKIGHSHRESIALERVAGVRRSWAEEGHMIQD